MASRYEPGSPSGRWRPDSEEEGEERRGHRSSRRRRSSSAGGRSRRRRPSRSGSPMARRRHYERSDDARGRHRRYDEGRRREENRRRHEEGSSVREYEHRRHDDYEDSETRWRRDDDGNPPRRAPRSSEICRDFMNGRCSRGDQCRFSHAGVDPSTGLAVGEEAGAVAEEAQPTAKMMSTDNDRMAQLFKEAGVTTIAEYNQRQKAMGMGGESVKAKPLPVATQAEIDEILPILEPLPESYRKAILAIPGCHQHIDTRHIKTLLRLNPKHAMAALHEFREAMEDIHSSIRNKGGYMMGVLRKYLPGEVASGVTYDGTAVSELEKSLLDTETFADPWKSVGNEDEAAKLASRLADEEERRRLAEEAKLRKSPRLPSDMAEVRRFVRKKMKEAIKCRPVLEALHAWDNAKSRPVRQDPRWASVAVLDCLGGSRTYAEGADAPLAFSSSVLPKALAQLVGVLESPPHPTLYADEFTAAHHVVYRYDARTALVHERGALAAPFIKPHDRATIVAWRMAPPALLATPNSWIRLRFSVTTALVPETNAYDRAAVPVHAWLLEPLGETQTRCTTWGVEELSPGAPSWIRDAALAKAMLAAASFATRLAKWLYKDADPELTDPIPTQLRHDWLQLAVHDNDDRNVKADEEQD